MSRHLVVLDGPSARAKVMRWIPNLPKNTRVEIKAPRRSLESNAKMWAMLSEIAEQVEWHGLKLSAQDYKDMFTAHLRTARIVPNIAGNGFVALGLHTSDMTKEEMSNLLELLAWFGADKGVKFSTDEAEVAA